VAEIYISSTYQDLKDCRLRANDALRGLGHTVRAMETYVAEDGRSLDVCRRDVRECALYVGIFAWRYGWIPPGETKSITHLEYEQARVAGKTCLIFLLEDNAPWPGALFDTNRATINTLRQSLSDTHTVSLFRDPTDLAKRVADAVKRWNPDVRPVSDYLPYLPDRGPQEAALRIALKNWAWRHPPVYMIPGDEQTSHEKFRERIMRRTLRLALSLTEDIGPKNYYLGWPTRARNADEIKSSLESELADAVEKASIEEAWDFLSKLPVPVAVHTHVTTIEWQAQGNAILDGFCRMWEGAPPLAPRQRLMAILTAEYRLADGTASNWGIRAILKRFRGRTEDFEAANRNFSEALKQLRDDLFPKCRPMVLEAMSCVEQSDTEQWARSDEVRRTFTDTDALIDRIRGLYRERERGCLPMAHLAPELKRILAAGS
jgi:hypothetical protein